MHMRKIIGAMAAAMLLATLLVVPAMAGNHGGDQGPPAGSDDPVEWDGTRGLDSEKCELAEEDGPRDIETGWLHWVLTPGGPTGATEAELTVNGEVVGTMSPQGNAGALQFFMPFEEPTSAVATPDGELGGKALLTISDWCAGPADNGNGEEAPPEEETPEEEAPEEEAPEEEAPEEEAPEEEAPEEEAPEEVTEEAPEEAPEEGVLAEEQDAEEAPQEVASQEVERVEELAHTGISTWVLALIATGLLAIGGTLVSRGNRA